MTKTPNLDIISKLFKFSCNEYTYTLSHFNKYTLDNLLKGMKEYIDAKKFHKETPQYLNYLKDEKELIELNEKQNVDEDTIVCIIQKYHIKEYIRGDTVFIPYIIDILRDKTNKELIFKLHKYFNIEVINEELLKNLTMSYPSFYSFEKDDYFILADLPNLFYCLGLYGVVKDRKIVKELIDDISNEYEFFKNRKENKIFFPVQELDNKFVMRGKFEKNNN